MGSRNRLIGTFVLALAVTAVVCLGLGRFSVPFLQSLRILVNAFTPWRLETTWSDRMESVILAVRLPRLMGAMLVGSALEVLLKSLMLILSLVFWEEEQLLDL